MTKSNTYEVELRGHSFLVTGAYNPGEPRVTSGPAERWYPDSPECVEIEKVELVRGNRQRELHGPIKAAEGCDFYCCPGGGDCERCMALDALLEELEEKILESMQEGDCGTDYDPDYAAERRAEILED